MRRHVLLFSLAVTLLTLPSFAQNAEDDPDVKRVIEEQQKQIESLQKALEEQALLMQELRALLESLAPGVAEMKPLPEEPVEELAEEPVETAPGRRALISHRDKHDLESPSSSNVTYFDSSARALIPDWKTEVGVFGLAEFQILHDTVGIDNNRFDTATIPVDGGPSQTKFNVNPTQIAVSSATDVSNGRLNTWVSLDLNGELTKPAPRLRIAFGEYVNDNAGVAVLLGQTYSTTLDLRAVPETLDFALPAGLWQLRLPLLRVSKAAGDSWTTEVSVESPENVTYAGAVPRTKWPDFSVAGTWLTGSDYFKHLRLAGLVRDLRAEHEESGLTDSAVGWAVSGSTKVGLPLLGERDNLKVTAHFGEGYGLAIKGGPQEGVFNEDTSELETIGIVSAFGGLQHFWSEQFRSNLAFGWVEADNPDFVADETLKSTSYLALNLVWSPFATTTFGVEYLWGEREEESGESGTSNRFILSSKFQF